MRFKVAIIIPCHNSGLYLEKSIYSILDSTKFDYKIILVESESIDGTSEFCDALSKKYKFIETYHIPKRGLVNAINFGIEKAGKLDVYLTQDDTIHFKLLGRDWLKELHHHAHPELHGIKKGEYPGLITSIHGWGTSGEDYLDGLNWVGTWSCYIPRRTINLVGLYDENLGPGDDIDYSYRVLKLGLCIGISDFWVQHHRMTDHRDADDELKIKLKASYFRKKWNLN